MSKKAFVFPGQGSQYVGMGKVLLGKYKFVEEVFQEASDSLDIDMKKLCFESSNEELKMTKNAQPALLTISYSMYLACKEILGINPDIMAGHSLGEISALTCAGVIPFADAVKLARKRGEFMQQAVNVGDGIMAAIQTRDSEWIQEICNKVNKSNGLVDIANYNSNTQVVISGEKAAVNKVLEEIEANNVKTKLLEVSAPFHCGLMKPAADLFEDELRKYNFNDPNCIVLSNATASPYLGKQDVVENLTRQIVQPVRWVECMKYLKKEMVQYGIELGPMSVLKNLMKRNISDIPFFAFDVPTDIDAAKKYIEENNVPFISRVMGIAVATKNRNFDDNAYRVGVIEPYSKLQRMEQMIETEERKASKEEMCEAIDLLLEIMKTKNATKDEREERIRQLFVDTGTEELFREYSVQF